MIDTRELRLGNYFIYEIGGEKFTTSVTAIKNHGVEYDSSSDNWCAEDDLEPIPLTPELLEKCRFKIRHEAGNLWDLEGYEKITANGKNRGQGFICLADFRESQGWWLDIQSRATIKTLHELQNLYFALTGQELEVNI